MSGILAELKRFKSGVLRFTKVGFAQGLGVVSRVL